MIWYPHVTVAAVIEYEGKFLLVYENSDSGAVYNQPAGHLEKDETLLDAVVRETKEETGWLIAPTHLLGIRQYTSPTNGITYIRHSFIAEAKYQISGAELDPEIINTVWFDAQEISLRRNQLRSPLVIYDIEAYLRGTRYPLNLLYSQTPEP